MKESWLGAYTCSMCKLKFPFEKVKYGPDGKSLICIDCNEKLRKNQKSQQHTSISKESILPGRERHQSKDTSNYVKVFCRDCNYRFSVRKGSKVKIMCPYCGKSRISKDELSAETILNKISEEDWP